MKKQIVSLLLILLICSCATNRMNLQKQGGQEFAVQNAINDFRTCRISKNHRIFSVEFENTNDDIIAISIIPLYFTYHITLIDTVGSTRLPTRHILKDGNLFYWYDSNFGLTTDIVNTFHQFRLIDSVNHADLGLLLGEGSYYDDAVKAAVYYFCKNDLTKYKRVITNRAMEWRGAPKLKCPKSSVGK